MGAALSCAVAFRTVSWCLAPVLSHYISCSEASIIDLSSLGLDINFSDRCALVAILSSVFHRAVESLFFSNLVWIWELGPSDDSGTVGDIAVVDSLTDESLAESNLLVSTIDTLQLAFGAGSDGFPRYWLLPGAEPVTNSLTFFLGFSLSLLLISFSISSSSAQKGGDETFHGVFEISLSLNY